jgi:D-alanyl-D-alanine dipeptidase
MCVHRLIKHCLRALALGLSLALVACGALDVDTVPADFVVVDDPRITTDVRYYSTDNFVGERIDGYRAPRVYMSGAAYAALLGVVADLEAFGLGLKLFDAYRPQQAVNHFVRWAEDIDDTRMKSRYYPLVDKRNLFRDGYIAARSGHSRGSTVDLTIVDLATGEELDMGTPWDYFDLSSWGAYTEISAEQRANRALLRSAMARHGFNPITTEWWHFTLADEPYPATFFNFPVE